MATIKQAYGSETSVTVTGGGAGADLDDLANAATYTSPEIDNTTNLYDEIILELKVGGTAATTAWEDVRILASIDGGTDYSVWTTPYLVLPPIDMSVDNPIYHARFVPPPKWKFAVKNNTGAAHDVGAASYVGVTYTVA